MEKLIRKCKKLFKNGKSHQQLREPQRLDTPAAGDPGPLEATSSLSRPRGLQGRPSLEAQRLRSSSDNPSSSVTPAAAAHSGRAVQSPSAPAGGHSSRAAATAAGTSSGPRPGPHSSACSSPAPQHAMLAGSSTSTSRDCSEADPAGGHTLSCSSPATSATTDPTSCNPGDTGVPVAVGEGPGGLPPTAAASALVEESSGTAQGAGPKGVEPNHTPRDEDLQGCPPYATKAVWGLRYTMEDKWAAVPNLIQVPAAFASPPANTGPGANHSGAATYAAASCGCIKRSSREPKEPKDKDKEPAAAAKSLEATPLRTAAAAGSAGTSGSHVLGTSSNCEDDTESLHYFAVFDGHGGAEAAKFCAAKMHSVVEGEIAGLLRGEGAAADNTLVPSSSGAWLQAALVRSFVTLDQQFAAVSQGTYVGTTAVVLLLGRTRLWVAHCGDSRCVLSRSGSGTALTQDHKANRDDEVARVQAAGGHVWWDRVMGELAVSRAIGDHCLRPYVIPEPEVSMLERTPEDELLVLASDGLWDVISNQEAADMALHVLNAAEASGLTGVAAVRKTATALTKAALDRGTRDNVTVLVVDLRHADAVTQE